MLKSNYLTFLLIAFLTILFTYEFNNFIQTDSFIVKNMSDKYTQDIINEYINLRHQWTWVLYIFILILLYLSTSLIALIIQLVIFLYYINDNTPKVKYKDTWKIVLIAQWSPLLALILKIGWFGYFHTHFSMEELQLFSPLSLINFFDENALDVWWIYPIQLVNVFEVAYWILLIIGIKKLLKTSWYKSFEIILLSYGLALIVWVVVIMFISLNFSQV